MRKLYVFKNGGITHVLIFLFLIIFSGCSANHSSNENREKILEGRVRTVTEKAFSAKEKFGEVLKDYETVIPRIYLYDIGFLYFFSDHLIRQNYDKKGQVISMDFYDTDGDLTYHVNVLYEDGRRVKDNLYDSDGDLVAFVSYTYDIHGKMNQQIVFHDEGKEFRSVSSEYDEQERLISNTFLAAGSNFQSRFQHEYEKSTRRKSTIIHTKDGDETILTYSYYENDFIKQVEYKYGWSVGLIEFVYEFDKKGNWIKKIIYEDGDADTIVEREIEYY